MPSARYHTCGKTIYEDEAPGRFVYLTIDSQEITHCPRCSEKLDHSEVLSGKEWNAAYGQEEI